MPHVIMLIYTERPKIGGLLNHIHKTTWGSGLHHVRFAFLYFLSDNLFFFKDKQDYLLWIRCTLYLQKLALTSPTSNGRSVDLVRSQTQATEVFDHFIITFASSPKWRTGITTITECCYNVTLLARYKLSKYRPRDKNIDSKRIKKLSFRKINFKLYLKLRSSRLLHMRCSLEYKMSW
jgi:hypothetical protein